MLAAVFLLAAACVRRTPTGPAPEGEKVMDGVVLYFDASADGEVVVAERRGRKPEPGMLREQVAILGGPGKKVEDVGRGSMLGEVSDDGEWAVWLGAKERHKRTGPVRLRQVAGGPVLEAGSGMPPFRFDASGTRALWLGAFHTFSGLGSLFELELPEGRPRTLLNEVPPESFFPLPEGETLALQRPRSRPCRAMRVGRPGKGAPRTVANPLDCDDPRPAIVPDPAGGFLFRHAEDGHGRKRLSRWTPGSEETATLTEDADAYAFDRAARLWWAAEPTSGRISLHSRDLAGGGSTTDHGEVEGRFVRGVHPVPGGGAWILLADRRCEKPGSTPADGSASSPIAACLRWAPAGGAPPPPELGMIRRVVSHPAGWPVAAFAGAGAAPVLRSIADPARSVEIGSRAIAAEFSADGRHLAARIAAEDGERVVLVDLTTGETRVISEQAPEEGEIRWIAGDLFHAWRSRRHKSDTRNGLYRVAVRSSSAGGGVAAP